MKLNLLERIGIGIAKGVRATKDFGVTPLSDYGWFTIGGGTTTHYPGTDLNWDAEAGDLSLNAVISICSQFIIDKIALPHLHTVYEDNDGMLQPTPQHPCTQLLEWANPEYRGRQLLSAMAISYKLDGNAYAVKVRAGTVGLPQELWYVPHWQMAPVPPKDGGPTKFYKHTYRDISGATTWKLVPRENVVHVRNGLDPENPRKGLSQIKAILRSVVADNEVDTYTALIMRGLGVPGSILMPDGNDTGVTPEQFERVKQKIQQNSTGDARGGMTAISVPVKITYPGRSPEDLKIDKLGDRPTQRICAAFGIDPAAIGLAPLRGEKYGSARKEARESSFEQAILPTLSVFAEAWTQDLLTDFAAPGQANTMGRGSHYWCEYDYSNVRDLQEDADAVHKRAQDDFKAGLLTLDEGRSQIGKKDADDSELGEKFYFQLSSAGTGGEFGVKPTANDAAANTGTQRTADPDDEDLPEEPDEDENDD